MLSLLLEEGAGGAEGHFSAAGGQNKREKIPPLPLGIA